MNNPVAGDDFAAVFAASSVAGFYSAAPPMSTP
jgi:hypothetical protein